MEDADRLERRAETWIARGSTALRSIQTGIGVTAVELQRKFKPSCSRIGPPSFLPKR